MTVLLALGVVRKHSLLQRLVNVGKVVCMVVVYEAAVTPHVHKVATMAAVEVASSTSTAAVAVEAVYAPKVESGARVWPSPNSIIAMAGSF
jgi:hypothetical protein